MPTTTPFAINRTPSSQGYPFALYALWFFLLMAVARLGEIIPPLGAIPLAKIAVVLCVIGIFMIRKQLPDRPLLSMPAIKCAAWLLVACCFSVLVSLQWKQSIMIMLTSVAVVATGAVLTAKLCSDRQRLISTLYVFVLIGVIQAVTAVSTGTGRISAGDSYDPNDLAYLLVTVIPLSMAFVSRSTSNFWRWTNVGILVLLFAAVLLTQSRGGLLGLAGGMAYLIFAKRIQPQKARKKSGSGLAARLLLAVLAAVVVWSVMPDKTRARLATLVSLESDYNTDINLEGGRMAIWTRNFKAAIKRPVGFGLGSFERVDSMQGGRWRTAHNSPLLVMVEVGVIGCLLFLATYIVAFRSLGNPRPDDPEAVAYCRALRAGLIANFIAGFFLSQSYSSALWTLIALCAVSATMFAAPQEPAAAQQRWARPPHAAH